MRSKENFIFQNENPQGQSQKGTRKSKGQGNVWQEWDKWNDKYMWQDLRNAKFRIWEIHVTGFSKRSSVWQERGGSLWEKWCQSIWGLTIATSIQLQAHWLQIQSCKITQICDKILWKFNQFPKVLQGFSFKNSACSWINLKISRR